MLIRLILIAVLIYWGLKLVKSLFLLPPVSDKPGGKKQHKMPFDISEDDIEDADFEEIDE